MQMQAGTIANVPLDGTAQVTVPFPSAYGQYVSSVQLTYNPATETDYQVTGAVVGTPTTTGFVMVATGAPPGSVGNFTFVALGY